MRQAVVIFGVVLVLLAGAVGCGGDDEDGSTSADLASSEGGGESDTTSESGGSASGSQGDSSDGADVGDLSVPLAPGAEVLFTDENEAVRTVLYTVPADRRDAAIDFYDEWTSSQTDDFQRIVAEAGGVSWIGSGTQILVSSALDGEAQVQIIVTG